MRWLAALAVLLLLSGCLSGKPGPSTSTTVTAIGPAAQQQVAAHVAPGCDPERVAVARHANATPATYAGARPIGCLVHTGVDSSEPTLGIAKDGTLYHYPAAVIDRDTPAAAGVRFLTGVAQSRDNGSTWRVLLPTAGPAAPTHQASLDPYFWLDPKTDRIFADDLEGPNCSILSFSDDQGATWTNSLSGCMEFDHQTLFTGPPVSSTTVGYPDILYRCAINLVAEAGATSQASTCTKSLDGGLTNVLTGEPAFVTDTNELPNTCDGGIGHSVADSHGAIYIPKGWCGRPYLAISKDEGATWTRVKVADGLMPGDANNGFAHDAGVDVDSAGNIYYFWIAADRLPYLAISRDGGAHWSNPAMVGPPGLNEANLPALAVGAPGHVAFAYFGAYDSPGKPWTRSTYTNTTWHVVLTESVDALDADPTYLTASGDPPGDPVARGACGLVRCNDAVKDFISLEVSPDGTPWVALVDGCLDACKAHGQQDIDGREGAMARLWGGPSLL